MASIKVGELGKLFNYGTQFDLSSNTELTLKFTSPTDVKFSLTKTGTRVTAPATASAEGFEANTYMQIATLITDFTESGTWTVCGTYANTGASPPESFDGNDATFTIGEACD